MLTKYKQNQRIALYMQCDIVHSENVL